MTTTAAPPISARRQRIAWYLYDFGNSAYASVVYLAIFSTYFKQVVVGGAEGSRLWGLAIGIALIIVALLAPVLGAMADFSGAKKALPPRLHGSGHRVHRAAVLRPGGRRGGGHAVLHPGRDRLPQLAGLLRRLPARAGPP